MEGLGGLHSDFFPALQRQGLAGEMVIKLRTERGWSREQLAEKAELDIKTVERVESGQGVKLATIVAVAQALGVAIEILALERG